MIRINFFGDFIAPDTDGLRLDDSLKETISCSDINVVNLEAPAIPASAITEKKFTKGYKSIVKSGPSLFQSESSPEWLQSNGINLVSLANNHIMDYDIDGLLATRNAFGRSLVVGAGDWQEAYTPGIVRVKGKRIAFFALSQLEFGNLTDEWNDFETSGVAWINHPKVDTVIQKTRKEVDYLFVYAHAGLENVEQPLPEWRDRYRQLIDLGCDAVIASHPHTAQGWEFYQDRPIVYSLGNFYFPQRIADTYGWNKSLCASILIEDDNISLDIIPLHFSDKTIAVCTDKEYRDYLERVNSDLANRRAYMEYINEKCRELAAHYRLGVVASGLGSLSSWRDFKRYWGFRLRHPEQLSLAPLLNTIRCETHRWCCIRAMKLKDKNIL